MKKRDKQILVAFVIALLFLIGGASNTLVPTPTATEKNNPKPSATPTSANLGSLRIRG